VFADYAPVSGIPFAHTITLFVARGETRAEIQLRDVELNPALPVGVFSVRPPQSAALGRDG
jgi:outer membrane lipoprotein-sorting protein